jgi:hypothetical protein
MVDLFSLPPGDAASWISGWGPGLTTRAIATIAATAETKKVKISFLFLLDRSLRRSLKPGFLLVLFTAAAFMEGMDLAEFDFIRRSISLTSN